MSNLPVHSACPAWQQMTTIKIMLYGSALQQWARRRGGGRGSSSSSSSSNTEHENQQSWDTRFCAYLCSQKIRRRFYVSLASSPSSSSSTTTQPINICSHLCNVLRPKLTRSDDKEYNTVAAVVSAYTYVHTYEVADSSSSGKGDLQALLCRVGARG